MKEVQAKFPQDEKAAGSEQQGAGVEAEQFQLFRQRIGVLPAGAVGEQHGQQRTDDRRQSARQKSGGGIGVEFRRGKIAFGHEQVALRETAGTEHARRADDEVADKFPIPR